MRDADFTTRHWLWAGLLVAASLVLSLGVACAVPLAAFAAAAALTSSLPAALGLVAAVWFVNQAAGFAVLDYPWTATTFVWGAVLGSVTLLATVAARAAANRFSGANGVVLASAAFLAAFVAYEGGLFVVSATLLGGVEDFAPAIVGQILEVNVIAMAALLMASRLVFAFGSAAPAQSRVRRPSWRSA